MCRSNPVAPVLLGVLLLLTMGSPMANAAPASAPTLTVQPDVTISEAQALPAGSLTATATDLDGAATLTFDTPTGIVLGPCPASGLTLGEPMETSVTTLEASLVGIPSYTSGDNDPSVYVITWSVSDDTGGTATATQSVTVGNANRCPTIEVPSDVTAHVGETITIEATGSDADINDVLTISATGFPDPPLTFDGNVSSTPGDCATAQTKIATISGTLRVQDVGVYTLHWGIKDDKNSGDCPPTGGGDSRLTVLPNAPVLTVPANQTVNEGDPVVLTATATDVDATDILTFTQLGMPTDLVFTSTPGVSPVTATITGTLSFGASVGSPYSIAWTVNDGAGGTASATTILTVNNVNRAPVITAPANLTRSEGTAISLTAIGTDPDAADILTMTQTGMPLGLTFTSTSGLSPRTATISGVLSFTSAGTYSIVWTATDNGSPVLSVSGTTVLTVNNVNRAPVITVPANLTQNEGTAVSLTANATDADAADTITMTQAGKPASLTFTPTNGNPASAMITGMLAAGSSSGSPYTIVWTAADNGSPVLSASASTVLTVDSVNHSPLSQPGGPYAGIAGVALSFSGNTSFDPDGDALTYEWDFDASDGITVDSASEFPSHTYGAPGTVSVTLTVRDPALLASTGTTTATISDVLQAETFATGANRAIRLESGKPLWCAQVQPSGNSYSNSDVMLNTIGLTFGASSILVVPGKTVIASDRNGDGVQEITACFAKSDLRTLFASAPSGRSTQTVIIGGELSTGGRFQGTMQVDVVKSVAALSATISPNPMNPQATLNFRTTRSGFARVRVYDLAGRLVQSLVDESNLAPGYHDVSISGRRADGDELPSGIYFYRVETAEGATNGRFTILR